ncbi:ATP-binding protein [Kitasatospora viridis]|uniref:Anti-sigma regulatory factor (Ser/Thr protein kinase) n=1 Tax=Kitasatospora viridis TaxID=281105 RepID=A0A561UBE1_9ACTN|nr:ATP-binding protein [Kitasatospora viridis]TWF96659.1 anti-sigma regulatory factor (Ser/Thr protein kinase) [Kitasatospora viridis]
MPEAVSQPPSPTAQQHFWLPYSKRTPRLARQQLREFLAALPNGARFSDTGELLVSELVTNALQHGTQRGQLIKLSLEADEERLIVSVEDASDLPPQLRALSAAESGYGLHLVSKLANAWGWGPREGVGKRVWCVCAPSPAGAAP